MRVRSIALVLVTASLAVGVHDARANTWPPASGADMRNPSNWPNDPSYTTDWNFWSWLPQHSPGAQPFLDADTQLGASGMHIDVAWTHTIGRPDVRIAICDSGIEWDNSDLVNKAYLNAGELGGSKQPNGPTGAPCAALTPASMGWDCDGDGVFTVADYRDDKRMSPMTLAAPGCPGGMTLAGDLNQNCILDPGDLIEKFSDAVDDDGNGYTDDISGWDFYKNDNNPYDDTRYGHGSGEARDSTAEGNNGIGDIGVCPLCRFMMLRAGDSFIADANDFAKGVVYATDSGAKVVQEALGTIDQTAFSKAAIDYAYARGTIVVASMADENSRHHNMPGAANHTLPVHAISQNSSLMQFSGGQVVTDATTFIAFNTCTNYGGQNMLSVSGDSCSSEAAGKGSGEAGLVYSEGLNKGLQLSAEEVMQLLKMNAEFIDVPQSRSTDPNVSSTFYESLPYFSQRFGYGRPNMDRTMQAIDAGLIPPEVDLVSPEWFDVLYADHVSGPVPVIGRVAAARAQGYDYTVEWAPGVEPADSLFKPLVDWVRNVQPATATGGPSSPIAMMSPSQMNTAHVRDPDSPHGENDRTVTLRIRAIAHYPGGDVQGQARRTIAIVNALPPTTPVDAGTGGTADAQPGASRPVESYNGLDPDLARGFPIDLGASIETSPKLADIDGDGVRDIVASASDGSVHVFSLRSGSPTELPGFPYHTDPVDGLNPALTGQPGIPGYLGAPAYSKSGGVDPMIAREAIVATAAIGDVDGDGKPEIVVSTWGGTVHVITASGHPLAGWPKRLPLVPSCPLDPTRTAPAVCMDTKHKWSRGAGASPVLADFDGDGKPEIVQAAFDGNVYVWHGDGSAMAGWPVAAHAPTANTYNRILSTPAVGDFNGDGVPDIVVGSNEEIGAGNGAGPVFLIDGRGTATPGGSAYFPDWPVTITSLYILPIVGEGVDSAPAIADFGGNGKPEILAQGNGQGPYIFPVDPGKQAGLNPPPGQLPVYHTDAGTQVGFDPTSVFGDGSRAFRPDTMFPLFSHPSVGDLDGDGVLDVVMAGGSLSLAFNQAGGTTARPFQHLLSMWSGATGHMMYGSPVPIEDYTFLVNEIIADITGDGYPEVILGTGGYFVHAVDACGCEASKWPKFTDGWLIATTAVGDVDGDHKVEIVAGTRDGKLFGWHTPGEDTGVIQWESFHHDNANTGNYATKLDQGVLRTARKKLDCSLGCAAASTSSSTTQYKAGGCGCRAVSADGGAGGGLAVGAVLGLAGLVARRRRRGG